MRAAVVTYWIGSGTSPADAKRPALCDLGVSFCDITRQDAHSADGALIVECELTEAAAKAITDDPQHGADAIFELSDTKPNSAALNKLLAHLGSKGVDHSKVAKDGDRRGIVNAITSVLRAPKARGR